MYKNQLQELAQRCSFNLPAYSCIREGPDHAPKFKASVNFNGETFESPDYYPTLRQAEHAAAEVALNVLSTRGPSQSLAAKVLDETGVCKNLLQETAQREGVSLPVYSTIKGGPGHVPVFSSIVEVGGRAFAGEPAKTKKQAEKNAAMEAWAFLKQVAFTDHEFSTSDELEMGPLTLHKWDYRSQLMPLPHRYYRGRPSSRTEGKCLSREGSPAGRFQHRRGSSASSPSPSGKRSYEAQKFLANQQPSARNRDFSRSDMGLLQRSHSLTGIESSMLSQQDVLSKGSVSGSSYLAMAPALRQYQLRPSRLSLQSCSDRFELRRPFMEDLELLEREADNEWLRSLSGNSPSVHLQPQRQLSGSAWEGANSQPRNRRALFHSQSERFELKPSLLDELYQRDEEDWWLKGEMIHWKRDNFAAYKGSEKGAHGFDDRKRGPLTGTENVFYPSGYSNELGSTSHSYSREDRDMTSAFYGGYGDNAVQNGPFSGRNEELASPSSYTGFNTTSQHLSLGKDMGSPSYDSFNADSANAPCLAMNSSQSLFSGYPTRAHPIRMPRYTKVIDDEEQASSSSSLWSCPAQWWTSQCPTSSITSSAVSQSLGICPASSIAPRVRVRQTVSVCSASSSRSMAIDKQVTNKTVAQSLCYSTPSLDCTPSIEEEKSAEALLSQLRL